MKSWFITSTPISFKTNFQITLIYSHEHNSIFKPSRQKERNIKVKRNNVYQTETFSRRSFPRRMIKFPESEVHFA